jgi:hypothetical protein
LNQIKPCDVKPNETVTGNVMWDWSHILRNSLHGPSFLAVVVKNVVSFPWSPCDTKLVSSIFYGCGWK